jgi:hypothetical protein
MSGRTARRLGYSDHKYPILLEKATQLGDLLYKAFNTPSGLPVAYYDWQHQGPEKLVGERGVIIAQIRSECDVGGPVSELTIKGDDCMQGGVVQLPKLCGKSRNSLYSEINIRHHT